MLNTDLGPNIDFDKIQLIKKLLFYVKLYVCVPGWFAKQQDRRNRHVETAKDWVFEYGFESPRDVDPRIDVDRFWIDS